MVYEVWFIAKEQFPNDAVRVNPVAQNKAPQIPVAILGFAGIAARKPFVPRQKNSILPFSALETIKGSRLPS